ncbi:MAG: nucleotidyl transferase AbiEii/AbiGii toxin family protein [Cyanobacteria bacterium]|nr:nucleotidyl transferase AbiEii/AbiGii toxin family protein [Cyanobacteriota bacterium]
MTLSQEVLDKLAGTTGFQQDTLEKVSYLLVLLNAIAEDDFLRKKLVLKGGTALNLFFFDLPRLSVDIDLNYVGVEDRTKVLEDRKRIEKLITGIAKSKGLQVEKQTDDYACGQSIFSYKSNVVGRGSIKVDINYMHRITYWDIEQMNSSSLDSLSAKDVPIISLYELSAGKIVALLARTASRDLFDLQQLSSKLKANDQNLRLAYVLYAAKQPKDWREVTIEDISLSTDDVEKLLFPMVNKTLTDKWGSPAKCAEDLVTSCREFLKSYFPMTEKEAQFIETLRNKGRIEPELLTNDADMSMRMKQDPGLLFRASKAGKSSQQV